MGNDTVLLEVLSRTRRIETRLVRLCAHMGLDPTSDKERLTLVRESPPKVELQGYDVSIGDCLRYCQDQGIVGGITLTCRGEEVGALLVAPRRGA